MHRRGQTVFQNRLMGCGHQNGLNIDPFGNAAIGTYQRGCSPSSDQEIDPNYNPRGTQASDCYASFKEEATEAQRGISVTKQDQT